MRGPILKTDRKAMIVLVASLVGCIVMFHLFEMGETSADVAADTLLVSPLKPHADSTVRHLAKEKGKTEYYNVETVKHERFPFDPNTADSTSLLRLGLQPWQVRNIYKYRAKGGIYRTKADFARLYGLTVKQYRELEPYIRISSDYLPASTLFKDSIARKRVSKDSSYIRRDTLLYPVKIAPGEHIVLNKADSTMLKKVPGIGRYFARSIIRYGERLGGYVHVDQLDEIEDFPVDSKKFFIVENPQTKKLNVNTLSIFKMRKHPYMGFFRAKAIDDHRRIEGKIKDLSDLSYHRDFTPEAIERLRPYVEY